MYLHSVLKPLIGSGAAQRGAVTVKVGISIMDFGTGAVCGTVWRGTDTVRDVGAAQEVWH